MRGSPAVRSRRSSHNSSQGFKPEQQVVGEARALRWPRRRSDQAQRLTLHREIDLHVDLSRFHIRVAEKVFDRDQRYAGLEQMHALGVSKRVRADAGPPQRRHGYTRALKILQEEIAGPVA